MRHWKTEIVVLALEMLSGRGKKEYAREAQAAAAEPQPAAPAGAASGNGSAEPEEAVLAM